MVDKSFFIDSCDDVELGIKRNSKLEYRISYDESKPIRAIFVIIGGFGSSVDTRMLDYTRRQFASRFGVLAINVFYHGFCCRVSKETAYSAEYSIEKEDVENIKKVLAKLNLPYHSNLPHNAYYFLLEDMMKKQKEAGIYAQNNFLKGLSYTILPPNEEYQNYLLMPALDHINALKHLFKTLGGGGGNLPIIYAGGCYGSQIAHLIAKIAPHYTQGVIDVACAVLPREQMFMRNEAGEFYFYTEHLEISCHTKSFWTKNNFTKAAFDIRNLLNYKHLEIQKAYDKNCIFVSYHSNKDEFKTAKDKEKLYQTYANLGFDATLHLIKNESEIDGKMIRNLSHAGISNERVFKKELPLILDKLEGKSFQREPRILSYPSDEAMYHFEDIGDKYELKITPF
ncbi:DUF2920 family protein [Campylobacter upsaliensis]